MERAERGHCNPAGAGTENGGVLDRNRVEGRVASRREGMGWGIRGAPLDHVAAALPKLMEVEGEVMVDRRGDHHGEQECGQHGVHERGTERAEGPPETSPRQAYLPVARPRARAPSSQRRTRAHAVARRNAPTAGVSLRKARTTPATVVGMNQEACISTENAKASVWFTPSKPSAETPRLWYVPIYPGRMELRRQG